MKYNLVKDSDSTTVTAMIAGELYSANDTHPQWDKIIAGILADDESVADLFSLETTVRKKFLPLSDRVAVLGGNITFDGDVVDNSLTRQILRFLEAKVEDWKPLVNFFEKVAANPSPYSRENFYRYVESNNITIYPSGDVLLYKGVQGDGSSGYQSISTGTAYVDGVEHSGHIPNPIGAVVTMPRSEVTDDPLVHCHVGLHAGTWKYASDFSRHAVLEVKVDPASVVSVPTDFSNSKVRVCRYEVLGVIAQENTSPIYVSTDYDEDAEECDECGYMWDYCECDDDVAVVTPVSFTTVVDTTKNYLNQKRDKFGRFIPKA